MPQNVTACSRVRLGLVAILMMEKCCAFYGTIGNITVFTASRYWTLY